jgi:hypothetical protein
VFGRELRLPCDLLFGAPPDKERPTTDHAAGLVDHLHDIHDYARRHLKLASDRMKTRYDELANCAGYHEGDRVWLYRPTRKKKKSPKLQSSWDGPYKIIARINDVVYRIQKTPRSRMVVHLDRLATYHGVARASILQERGGNGGGGMITAKNNEPQRRSRSIERPLLVNGYASCNGHR